MGDTCSFCPEPATTKDHLIPRSLGIALGPPNIVPACRGCNLLKADKLPRAIKERAEGMRKLADRLDVLASDAERLIRERGLASILDMLQ